MPETTKTEKKPAATKAAPKVETKPVAKKAAPKAKPAAKKAAPKSETKSASNTTLAAIVEDQYDATSDTILSALNTLETQIEDARTVGSDIVSGFGGETKMAELIEKLAGYMGEATGTGVAVGMAPMMIMAGAAKGVYKKVTD